MTRRRLAFDTQSVRTRTGFPAIVDRRGWWSVPTLLMWVGAARAQHARVPSEVRAGG